jgi:hypothetical protein
MKIVYIIILFLLSNLYGFEGIEFYKKGEYKKAEKIFNNYAKETNSTVAKAYLAKIYYKEKKYKKSKKLIKLLLENNTVPLKVKKELKNYLDLIKGKKWLKAEISLGVLYDSNVKWDKSKKKDIAHIEEALIKGYYLKDNFETSFDFKVQNRGYIQYDKYNFLYIDTNAYLTHYSMINSRLKIGFENKTTNSDYLYKSELYLFKRFDSFESGIFAIGDYYKNDLDATNLGSGLRFGIFKNKFKTELSLCYYYENYDNKNLNNRNYKIDIKTDWNFLDVYMFVNYYYNIAKFNSHRNNIHYLDISLATKDINHLFYSIGITQYYAFNNSLNQDIRKYEVYAKFIFYF